MELKSRVHSISNKLILINLVGLGLSQCKKDSKDQESIQLSTTPVPGYQMRK